MTVFVGAEFTALWNDAAVVTSTHMIQRLDHPELGSLTLACDALLYPHRDQHIVMFSLLSASWPPRESAGAGPGARAWLKDVAGRRGLRVGRLRRGRR
jgi:hypothetical protein